MKEILIYTLCSTPISIVISFLMTFVLRKRLGWFADNFGRSLFIISITCVITNALLAAVKMALL